VSEGTEYRGTGRRKSSVVRAILRPGEGKIIVNQRPAEAYFPLASLQAELKEPLLAVEVMGKFDITLNAHGGGVHGQIGAARMGIARALLAFNPELRSRLRAGGFLTRDSRIKERKKYGQKGARKRFQFSKR
jgi:small subunit ribosomal protein S9